MATLTTFPHCQLMGRYKIEIASRLLIAFSHLPILPAAARIGSPNHRISQIFLPIWLGFLFGNKKGFRAGLLPWNWMEWVRVPFGWKWILFSERRIALDFFKLHILSGGNVWVLSAVVAQLFATALISLAFMLMIQ